MSDVRLTYDKWFDYGVLHGWISEKERNKAISKNKEMGVSVRKFWELVPDVLGTGGKK